MGCDRTAHDDLGGRDVRAGECMPPNIGGIFQSLPVKVKNVGGEYKFRV